MANGASSSSSVTGKFGSELRAWRTKRGWTQKDLGERLGWSESFISDVERGSRGVRHDFATKCDELFDAPGTFARWREAELHGGYASWFAPVVPHEQEAVRIHGWALGALPGLFQTADYARALIRARSPRDDDESVERKVSARIERQEVLSRPNPPLLHWVIYEAALRHLVGSREIMAAQLDSLIKSAESPGIVIQILPFDAHDHAGVEGPIEIFEPARGVTVGYTEFHAGGRVVEASTDVADLMTTLGMLRAIALSPRDSIKLMKQYRSELD